MTHTSPFTSPPQYGRIPLRELWAMLTPWRGWLALVGVSVLLGAVLELVPPLLVKQIVDAHLARGRSQGLLWVAVLYLGATAAVQAMGFLTEYLRACLQILFFKLHSVSIERYGHPCHTPALSLP